MIKLIYKGIAALEISKNLKVGIYSMCFKIIWHRINRFLKLILAFAILIQFLYLYIPESHKGSKYLKVILASLCLINNLLGTVEIGALKITVAEVSVCIQCFKMGKFPDFAFFTFHVKFYVSSNILSKIKNRLTFGSNQKFWSKALVFQHWRAVSAHQIAVIEICCFYTMPMYLFSRIFFLIIITAILIFARIYIAFVVACVGNTFFRNHFPIHFSRHHKW